MKLHGPVPRWQSEFPELLFTNRWPHYCMKYLCCSAYEAEEEVGSTEQLHLPRERVLPVGNLRNLCPTAPTV